MVDPLVVAMFLVLGPIALVSIALAVRNPLPFRIARRNIRRARARTILVLLGLLIATATIAGSLVVGDTVRTINVHYTYLGIGYTDEGVYTVAPDGGYLYFPQAVAQSVANSSAGIPNVAGANPLIIDEVQVVDRSTSIIETNLNLVGANASASAALKPFTSTTGGSLAAPDPGKIFVDSLLAGDLGAKVGDAVVVYGLQPVSAVIQAIVQDDVRGGVLTAGLSGGTVFTDLATAQQVENAPGRVNYIAVTNAGSQVDGIAYTQAVSSSINETLQTVPGASMLSVHNVLQGSVATAESESENTVAAFLAFGMFSILAGAMLIVGIFAMIAEERKGELGVLRAIGVKRGDIILSYFFEGLIYSAGAALVGTFVGVLSGYALMVLYTSFVPNSVVSGAVIVASFTYSDSSLVISYMVGFLLTLATVLVASFRVSRLNIVRAIRDVPEPPPPLRTYSYLAGLGVAALAAGGLLFAATVHATSDVSWPTIGGALLILGAGLIASRFARNRRVFSAVGAALLFWVGYEPLRRAIVGNQHSSGEFVIFVFGVMMVAGALLIVAFNGPALARLLERIAAGGRGTTPVSRIGLAYPSRRAARTSITLAIFSLVLFTIVALATFTATVAGSLQDSVQAQSGGYTYLGISTHPIPDLPGAVAANGTLAPLFSTVVPLVTGVADIGVTSFGTEPYLDHLYSAPANASPSSSFYGTNRFPFQSTWKGMSGAAAMSELESNGSVAVVDASYSGTAVYAAAGAHPVLSPGGVITVRNPASGEYRNLTVIGILKTEILAGVWISPITAAALGFTTLNGYLISTAAGVDTTHAAQLLKSAFFQYGLIVVNFAEALATAVASASGEITLLEVFIALGLAVGIAALGILALRAVIERRHDLGIMRATGMSRLMVLRAFLLEYSFVTLLGAAIGVSLGILIIYNLTIGPDAAASGVTGLYVPWLNILTVLLVTGLLATLAVIVPSLRASRLSPAQAIRGVD